MRWPIASDYGELILKIPLLALVLGGVYASCFLACLYLCHFVRLCHPEVYHGCLAVSSYRIEISARCRRAQNMNRKACIYDIDNFLGISIKYGHLAGIPQNNAEKVFPIFGVLRFLGSLSLRNYKLPALFHFCQ